MRFQFYCLDVIALAFRILGKNSNQFSVWMYKRIELVFVLLRPGPIRPSSARRSSRSASSTPPSSRRRRGRSPGRGGAARRRLRGRDGATWCCCFHRGARARGGAAAARATGPPPFAPSSFPHAPSVPPTSRGWGHREHGREPPVPGREAARERGGRWRPASAEKAWVMAGAPTEGARASREGGCRSSAGEWGGMEEQGSRPPRARRHPPMRGLLELPGVEGRAPPWGALEVAGEEDRGGEGAAVRHAAPRLRPATHHAALLPGE